MKSQYNTFVALPPRDALAVEIFEQGNGVLAGNTGEIFERRHGDSLTIRFFVSREFCAQLRKGVAMKDKIRRDAVESFFPEQELQQLF